jgi:hypothetical protein
MSSEDEIWKKVILGLNYCYPVIVVFGTIANILAFIIFSRKRFENTIFSTYFRFMLVVDTIGLVYLCLAKFLNFQFGINIRDFNESLCRLSLQLAYSVPPISAYILVAISIDRWLTITKPTFLIIRKKFSFQILVCIGIVIANFIYNGQLFFSYIGTREKNPNSTRLRCLIPYPDTLSMMDLINSTIIPFLLMIVSTALTIKSVFDSSRKNQSTNQVQTERQTRRRDIKFAITSIAFNIIFLILNLPFALSAVIPNTTMSDIESYFLVILLLFLTYLNHATDFFINISVNKIFREELKILFCIKTNTDS